jgi:RNase H-fold protein (predicted Holliday junction resolvase)
LKEFILIVNYSIKSVRDEKSKDDIGQISIIFDNNKIKKLEDHSTLLASIKKQENVQYIAIYAPVNWESDKQKKELRKTFEKEIKDLLIDCLNKS